MFVTLLLAYALGISAYLIIKQRTQSKRSELDAIWEIVSANEKPTGAEIKAIARIAKVRQSEIPWYERSISTIGIVAFFSMIIATGVQTLSSVKAEVESIRLRQEIKELEAQRSLWKKNVKELSEVIVLKQTNSGKLETSEEDILRQRLAQIEETASPSKQDVADKLKVYMALKRYDEASALVEQSTLLDDATSPGDLLFLAEMSFLDGAKGRAKALLKKFESELSKQPSDWQLRYLVVNAALSNDPKSFGPQVAALRHEEISEAEDWLMKEVGYLKDRARRRNFATGDKSDQ